MDGDLNSLQKDVTFQMKLLSYLNSAFIDRHREYVKRARLEMATERTRRLIELKTQEAEEAELSSALEDMKDLIDLEQEEFDQAMAKESQKKG